MTTTLKPFGKPLTPAEEARLVECEAIMMAGLQSFVETGNALKEISDSRLYRKTHPDFDSYLKEKWLMSARTAYRLIVSATVCEEVRPIGHTLQTESQARELAKAPAGTRAAVLKEAKRTAPGGKVTAKHIAETIKPVEPVTPPTEDAKWKEALGVKEVPPVETAPVESRVIELFMRDQDELCGQVIETLTAAGIGQFKLHLEVWLKKLRQAQKEV